MTAHVLDHPLVRHKVGLLRDASSGSKLFGEVAAELAGLLAYEACRDLSLGTLEVETWRGPLEVPRLEAARLTVAPVLRAGLGMLGGVLRLLPSASVSVLGMRRDEETLLPQAYYENLAPHVGGSTVLLLDPMLATGGTAVAAVHFLKRAAPAAIHGLFLIAAPEGVEAVERAHPDCTIWTAALDERLDERGYILPGLGDAGDRLFGTRPR
jgi:uracil phosphoribosyltransferase